MKRIDGGIELYFLPEDRDTADVIEVTCQRSLALIDDLWGLAPPKRCQVIVMTSMAGFILRAAPWYKRLSYALALPIWWFRLRRVWTFAGGITQFHRHRPVIGVKPPRLIATTDRSVGKLIYVEELDATKKTQHIACHELTHAFSAHLKLPMWLNEGIAMLTVDRYFDSPSVRTETLQSLNHSRLKRSVGKYRNLPGMNNETLVYHYVRGYWITRFLMETQPDLLKASLRKRQRHNVLHTRIAAALEIPLRRFWDEIDGRVIEHFSGESRACG